MELTRENRNKILDDVFTWSARRGFKGYNKHDGLNSSLLSCCMGWSKWTRIIAIQAVMRCPVNIRPLLGVPATINPKGLALFILGLLDRYKHEGNATYLASAKSLAELLFSTISEGNWSGSCWGYSYPWQDLGFYAPPHTPNAVVTSFVCEALLGLYKVTGDECYLDHVGSAVNFFLKDLIVLEDTTEHMCLAYMPLKMSMRVLDVSILVGAVLAQYAVIRNDAKLSTTARRLVQYVVDQQTDYFAWYYTDPPEDSLINHDNYHTGFILDALWRYMSASGDWSWKENYEKGLRFYAEHLFNSDGSPRWMSDTDYPHDIHGSAQGLVSFSLALENGYNEYSNLMNNIGMWAIDTLYVDEGRFMYRESKYYITKYTLLRWCNAWMFRGIASWR